MWSPCIWVMKIRLIWLVLRSLRSNWCWVPSPQSNNQTSARWGSRRATLDTLRDRVGTPELVPKKVICTFSSSLNLVRGKELTFLHYVTQQVGARGWRLGTSSLPLIPLNGNTTSLAIIKIKTDVSLDANCKQDAKCMPSIQKSPDLEKPNKPVRCATRKISLGGF